MENQGKPQEIPKHSETVQLVIDIEMLTGSTWTQVQRHEVAELIRKYRFNQVGSVVLRIQALIRDTGNAKLSELIYSGRW